MDIFSVSAEEVFPLSFSTTQLIWYVILTHSIKGWTAGRLLQSLQGWGSWIDSFSLEEWKIKECTLVRQNKYISGIATSYNDFIPKTRHSQDCVNTKWFVSLPSSYEHDSHFFFKKKVSSGNNFTALSLVGSIF